MVMGDSQNSHVYIFAILLKSRKFDAHEIYVFYSTVHGAITLICIAAGRACEMTGAPADVFCEPATLPVTVATCCGSCCQIANNMSWSQSSSS